MVMPHSTAEPQWVFRPQCRTFQPRLCSQRAPIPYMRVPIAGGVFCLIMNQSWITTSNRHSHIREGTLGCIMRQQGKHLWAYLPIVLPVGYSVALACNTPMVKINHITSQANRSRPSPSASAPRECPEGGEESGEKQRVNPLLWTTAPPPPYGHVRGA
jgi:hypothetical protein